jgi:hypothetical protein
MFNAAVTFADVEKTRKALAMIAQHKAFAHFAGPQNDEAIGQAERVLSASFPPSYRLFTATLGGGSFVSGEIYGVISGGSGVGPPDVVCMTQMARRDFGIPDDFILVRGFDDASSAALDLADRAKDGECAVVRIWEGEPDEEYGRERIAGWFGDFILEFVEERLSLL